MIDVYYLERVNGIVDERWELCYMIYVHYLEPVNGTVDEMGIMLYDRCILPGTSQWYSR